MNAQEFAHLNHLSRLEVDHEGQEVFLQKFNEILVALQALLTVKVTERAPELRSDVALLRPDVVQETSEAVRERLLSAVPYRVGDLVASSGAFLHRE